ncbi:hypothetical protein Tco_0635781 [Tanacetum coccineum]
MTNSEHPSPPPTHKVLRFALINLFRRVEERVRKIQDLTMKSAVIHSVLLVRLSSVEASSDSTTIFGWCPTTRRSSTFGIVFFFGINLTFRGLQSGTLPYLALVRKMSIRVLLIAVAWKTVGYHEAIEIDIHFVRDLVAVCHIRVLHVPSRYRMQMSSSKAYILALLLSFATA